MFKNPQKQNNQKNQNITSKPYRENELNLEDKNIEDTTKYGEFIPSYFDWLTLDQQKNRAEELENMTKDNKKLEK